MRFCEGVVPCGTALFAFVRESWAHSITPLGKQDSLNSGGVGAGPHSDQIGIITGFRGLILSIRDEIVHPHLYLRPDRRFMKIVTHARAAFIIGGRLLLREGWAKTP